MKNNKNSEVLEIISEANERVRRKEITKITDKKKLTTDEKFKISICKMFVQYLNENSMKPTELHRQTGIELSRISEIINYKINKFTIDKLLIWGEKLSQHSPEIKAHFALIEEVLNIPMMSVGKTRKIAQAVKTSYAHQSR